MEKSYVGISDITAPKIIIFIAMLLMLVQAVAYITAGGITILYGVLVLVFIIVWIQCKPWFTNRKLEVHGSMSHAYILLFG